jgi:predicted AAA+ superfamily ATPase
MTFSEFLVALDQTQLIAATEKREPRMAALVRNDFIKLLKYYFYVGGMPEVVLAFTKEKNSTRCEPYKNG